jgi:hypothetical protein
MIDRRAFLTSTAVAGLAAAAGATTASSEGTLEVATNTYPWGTFASRDGGTFVQHSDEALAAIASARCAGYEPIISDSANAMGTCNAPVPTARPIPRRAQRVADWDRFLG